MSSSVQHRPWICKHPSIVHHRCSTTNCPFLHTCQSFSDLRVVGSFFFFQSCVVIRTKRCFARPFCSFFRRHPRTWHTRPFGPISPKGSFTNFINTRTPCVKNEIDATSQEQCHCFKVFISICWPSSVYTAKGAR